MILGNSSQRAIVMGIVLAAVTAACGGGGGSGGGAAPPPSSTSTSTTTTSAASATTSSTTTTTSVAGGASYTVVFALDDAVTVGSLQLEVDYADAGGGFVGSSSTVSCTSPLSAAGALVAFGDDDSAARLNFAALALAGFNGPTSLASCEFRATGAAPTPEEFIITIVEANALDLSPIAPAPAVRVSSIAPR